MGAQSNDTTVTPRYRGYVRVFSLTSSKHEGMTEQRFACPQPLGSGWPADMDDCPRTYSESRTGTAVDPG